MNERMSEHFGLTVSVSLARGLVAELVKRGLPAEAVFEGLPVGPAVLDDPRAQLAYEDWDAMMRRALALTGDPMLGLYFGQRGPLQMYQLVGWLALAAPSVRNALSLLRYAQPLLASHVSVHLVERGNDAYLYYDQVALGPDTARTGADFGLSALHRFGTLLGLPPGSVREVWFRHAEPSYAAEYTRLFRCPVRFKRSRNALIFDRALLAQSNPAGDELVLRLFGEHAERLLSAAVRPSLAQRIQVLLLQEDALFALDAREIAQRLGTTPRALRWQLARDGQSMRRLTDEVRFWVARSLLCSGDVSVHELAEQLGFSEASAFYRAFKRWTGETPAAFVERERAGAVRSAMPTQLPSEGTRQRESGVWHNPLAPERTLRAGVG
jgi:AraC-like DNA-binding protein